MMLQSLALLLQQALTEPRAAARKVIALRLPLGTAVLGLLATSVLAALLGVLTYLASGMQDDPAMARVFASPFALALIQIAVQAVAAVLIWAVGRQFGGAGRLADAVALVALMEAVLLVAQALQLLLIGVVPLLAEGLGLMAMGLFLWLLTVFTAELHGFRALGAVFAGIVLTALAVAVLLVIILGATLGAGVSANV